MKHADSYAVLMAASQHTCQMSDDLSKLNVVVSKLNVVVRAINSLPSHGGHCHCDGDVHSDFHIDGDDYGDFDHNDGGCGDNYADCIESVNVIMSVVVLILMMMIVLSTVMMSAVNTSVKR